MGPQTPNLSPLRSLLTSQFLTLKEVPQAPFQIARMRSVSNRIAYFRCSSIESSSGNGETILHDCSSGRGG
jgi:hypothetical protein